MQKIGKAMQILGLTLPPVSILMQLANSISLGQMLVMLVVAVCLFGIGRIVEGYA